MSRRYPCIGNESKTKAKHCSCCDQPAARRVDIQTDWFRGNDDVFDLCGTHIEMARGGRWRQLYADFEASKARRKESAAVREAVKAAIPRVHCPTCKRRVKEVGLKDHMRDAHGAQAEA